MIGFYSPDNFYNYSSDSFLYSENIYKPNTNISLLKNKLSLNPYTNNQKNSIKKIGQYQYQQKNIIGQGFSSKVYKAYHIQNKNQYAIKVIDLTKMSKNTLDMLENQIDILKSLNHINIIKCYDIYKTNSTCYILTQYCSGGNLMEYFAKNKKLSENQPIQIMSQVIEGLKYIQQQGIIHRDLKPANILKSKNKWKIADFGFAIRSKTQINTKFNVGTPLYMPLQALIYNMYSPQSDIFSVGIIFYELLTGITPWQCKSESQLIKKMQTLSFQKVILRNLMNSPLIEILIKMCQTNKQSRMKTQQFLTLNLNDSKRNSIIKNPQKQNKIQGKDSPKIIHQVPLIKNKSMQLLKIKSSQNQERKNEKQGNIIQKDNLQSKKANQQFLKKNKSVQSISFNCNYPINNKKNIINQQNKRIPSITDNKLDNKIMTSLSKYKINYQINSPKNSLKQIVNVQIKQTLQKKINKEVGGYLKELQIIKIQNNKMKNLFNENTHLLINQIHYCRFIYYFYVNLDSILLQKKYKQKLTLLIFKYLFRLTKQLLSLTKQNRLNIYEWKQYIKTQKFNEVKNTIKQYALKYQKQYFLYLQKNSIIMNNNQSIANNRNDNLDNQNFKENQIKIQNNQLKQSYILQLQQNNQIFLNKYLKQIKLILIECNKNLSLTISSIQDYSNQNKYLITYPNKFILTNIQGLQNFYQFYKLIQLNLKCLKNPFQFQKLSKIKINKDYRKNITINIQDYSKLTQQINRI